MPRPVKLQVSVTPDLDRALRLFLADQNRSKKGGLSDFVAELVRGHLTQWVCSWEAGSAPEAAQPTLHAAGPAAAATAPLSVPRPAGTSAAPGPLPHRPSAPPAPKSTAPAAAPGGQPATPPLLSDADLVRLMEEAVRWGHATSRRP